ncbi:hypothetical protein GLOIN_2v1471854 [Rhizophagus clarus]|uniref:Uncharacterized protein n=1 Tax=Rhizophagus clarus TaxID=94130 RepID=A0A8H3L7Q9_9GLOM|nr:hypothetical protein GLOIN_2v1471854 [Rhizophagus clarus]
MVGDEVKPIKLFLNYIGEGREASIHFVKGDGQLSRLTESDGMGICKRSSKPDAFFGEIDDVTSEVVFPIKSTGKFFIFDIIEGCSSDNDWCVIIADDRPARAPSDTPTSTSSSNDPTQSSEPTSLYNPSPTITSTSTSSDSKSSTSTIYYGLSTASVLV